MFALVMFYIYVCSNSNWFNVLFCRTGFVHQPAKWFLVARAKGWRTMDSKLRWGTVPPQVKRGAGNQKNAPWWTSLYKQRQMPSPPPKIHLQPWPLPLAQHSPQPWSLTKRTVMIQARRGKSPPLPPDGTKPRRSFCQSSTSFIDPGVKMDAFGKRAAWKLKGPFHLGTE